MLYNSTGQNSLRFLCVGGLCWNLGLYLFLKVWFFFHIDLWTFHYPRVCCSCSAWLGQGHPRNMAAQNKRTFHAAGNMRSCRNKVIRLNLLLCFCSWLPLSPHSSTKLIISHPLKKENESWESQLCTKPTLNSAHESQPTAMQAVQGNKKSFQGIRLSFFHTCLPKCQEAPFLSHNAGFLCIVHLHQSVEVFQACLVKPPNKFITNTELNPGTYLSVFYSEWQLQGKFFHITFPLENL